MTPRQRVLAALQHQPTDRVPTALMWADLKDPKDGRTVEEDELRERFGADVRFVRLEPAVSDQAMAAFLESLPADVYLGNRRQLKRYVAWRYHPERLRDDPQQAHPLAGVTDVEQLERFDFPEFGRDAAHAAVAHQVEAFHRRELAVFGQAPRLGGVLFEVGTRLCGFEAFLIGLAERSEVVLWVLDRLADLGSHHARVLASADVDVLYLSDDVAEPTRLMISPTMWREMIGPRMRRIIDAARTVKPHIRVCYHSDGRISELVDELLAVGVDAIEPVQPDCMDVPEIAERYGSRLTLIGTIGTAQFWDWSTPEQVRAAVRERIAQFIGRGGLILGPAYDLLPQTPYENASALFDEARRCSRDERT
jgi:uroporphyrinogen decarboxylase